VHLFPSQMNHNWLVYVEGTLHGIRLLPQQRMAHGTLDVKFLSKKGGTLFYLRNLVSKVPPLLSHESKQSVYNNKIPVVRYTR
jgi:hypothetical protein